MYRSGYDYFSTEPYSNDNICCKICGEKCDVIRNTFGPTSYVSAMSGNHTYHDSHYCPNTENEWHHKAYELIRDIEKCNSDTLRKIMEKDLKKILQENNE